MRTDVFKFSPQFQRQLLRLMFSDIEFMGKYSSFIKSQYFEEYSAELLCSLLFRYYDKYESVPSTMVIEEELRDLKAKESSTFSPEKVAEIQKYFKSILAEEVTDIFYIEDKVLSFAKNQALKRFILTSTQLVLKAENDEDYDELWAKFDDAMSTGATLQDLGIEAFKPEEIEKRIEARAEGTRKDAIAFGIEYLDKKLYGGLCPGEVCALMAPSGVGKSIILTSIGTHVIQQGTIVFHYTLELTEKTVLNRYDASVTRIKYHDLNLYPEKVRSRALKALKKGKTGALFVKWMPGGETSMRDIANHVKMMWSVYKVKPGFIILDYGDELCSFSSKYSEHWIQTGMAFKEISNYAVKSDVPILTCTQTKITAIDKELITVKDIGESYKKVKVCDIILAFCQMPDEEKNNKARLFAAKVRDADSKYLVYVDLNKDKMKMTWDKEMQERRKT